MTDEVKYELEFFKLNLKEGDSLVIKVDTSNLNEQDAVKALNEVRDDDFLRYVKSRGHNIFISYTGIDISILRLNEGDKVLVQANVDDMSEKEAEKYIEFVRFKLEGNLPKDKLLIVPIRKNTRVSVLTTDKVENDE
jgi:hypothetical protein